MQKRKSYVLAFCTKQDTYDQPSSLLLLPPLCQTFPISLLKTEPSYRYVLSSFGPEGPCLTNHVLTVAPLAEKVFGRNDVLIFCCLKVSLCIRPKHQSSVCDRLLKMLEEHLDVRVCVAGTHIQTQTSVGVVTKRKRLQSI